MATNRKISKQATKRSASDSPVEMEHTSHQVLQATVDWANDHEFIAPNELYTNAIGLLFCLIDRRLINTSFTSLYHRSLKITWMDLLNRERRNLKSNLSSVEKCFMINRLLAECTKDPCDFARQTAELYEEIKTRMSCTVPSTWTVEDFYAKVRAWRSLQCQRRLFHFNHIDANQPQSLLTLQRMATNLFLQFQTNPSHTGLNYLKQLLEHTFIIVAQPSVPECVAATKYEKSGNTYSAKLFTRIICLLDPDIIEKHFTLSDVVVILHPLDPEIDLIGENQSTLHWNKRTVVNAKEKLQSFLYVELESIQLSRFDIRNSRPLYSAKLCQLHFQIKIKMNELNIENNLSLLSQPFGLCSHAQYYPEFLAKVLIHEISQMPQSSGSLIQPNFLTHFIYRYHTRISGVEPKLHTCQYIQSILQNVYEEKKGQPNITSDEIYGEILAKVLSQMEFFIDHPFLSMMYHDGLFLGICDSTLDQQLRGTREQAHMLLRFNTLARHQPIQHASVRYIVHNGQLTRATFHPKAFVDEMCRMICEANTNQAKKIRILSEIPTRNFHEFSVYFDIDLFRLNTAASPMKDAYQPLIPILWNTMRINTDEQSNQTKQQLNLPSYDSSKSSNEKVPVPINLLVQHLVEKLSDLLIKSPTTNISFTPDHTAKAAVLLSTLTDGDIQKQEVLLSNLIFDFLQPKTYAEVATQTSVLDIT